MPCTLGYRNCAVASLNPSPLLFDKRKLFCSRLVTRAVERNVGDIISGRLHA